ncbi:hypothetical protein [Saccharicrinis sp. 156]|uniref:hypothetical protein n=1 Tax=Saccharicrinis sp. 156 TaxID=3417574 RepID=UPI003D3454E8
MTRKVFITFFFLPIAIFASSTNRKMTPPPGNLPLKVDVNLRINKVYNINTVDETYQIDGYLVYLWKDERWKRSDGHNNIRIYENDRANEVLDTGLWMPILEFINIQGEKECPNRRIVIQTDGEIKYKERFFGTFSSNMNFINFPFDSQTFQIQIEAFSYDKEQLVFNFIKLLKPQNMNDFLGEKWTYKDNTAYIEDIIYDEISSSTIYSRAVFKVDTTRKPEYYMWQVLLPLSIIIMASFVIFWIKDFGTQMGVGFTLMLTVVAFNFYSASILPKLPYNTFLETIIIVGYVFIFVGIILAIVNYRIYGHKPESDTNKWIRLFRIGLPMTFFTTILILFLKFNVI